MLEQPKKQQQDHSNTVTNLLAVQQLQEFNQALTSRKANNTSTSQMIIMDDQLERLFSAALGEQQKNRKPQQNALIFSISMILIQIAVIIFYSILLRPYQRNFTAAMIMAQENTWFQNLQPMIICVLMIVLVVVGFGCLFMQDRKLMWSGLMYNLVIVCVSIQLYPIANYVVMISKNGNSNGFLFLSNYDQINYPILNINNQKITQIGQTSGKTLLDAIKCSLANCITFSAILGRSGPIDLLIVAVIGTFAYEVVRQLLTTLGVDFADSNSVFTYGGFCGIGIGVVILIKNRLSAIICKNNKNHQPGHLSIATCLLGCTLLITLFPILSLHFPPNTKQLVPTLLSTVPFGIYQAIVSSIITSIAISIMINGKCQVRDMINGAVGGGVASLNSCLFLVSPGFNKVVGMAAGLLQTLFRQFFQKRYLKQREIVTSYSFFVFGFQGFIGSAFATIWRVVIINNRANYGSIWSTQITLNWQISTISTVTVILGAIAAAIGFGVGIVMGILISLISTYRKSESMHDEVGFMIENEETFKEEETILEEELERQLRQRPNLIPFR